MAVRESCPEDVIQALTRREGRALQTGNSSCKVRTGIKANMKGRAECWGRREPVQGVWSGGREPDLPGSAGKSVLICRPAGNNGNLGRVLSVGGVIGPGLHFEKITGFAIGVD